MLLKRSAIALVLLVLLVGLMAASASAVSANTAKQTGNNGYVLSPGKGLDPGTIMPMSTSGSIRQGETKWYTRYVSGNPYSINIDLYWGNPSNSLRMRIYAPDGSIHGPVYDNFDGILNGDIPVQLYRQGGLPSGTYYIEVYGDRVSGTQSFSLN
jgi:hypothetical protein